MKFKIKSYIIRFVINIWSTFLITIIFFKNKKIVKKGAAKNFRQLSGKHQCLSLFLNKGRLKLQACNYILLKGTLWHRCFPANVEKLLQEHLSCSLQINRWKTWLAQHYSQIFFKISVFKNFAIFTERRMCWNLVLIKLRTFHNLIKKRLQHSCFTENVEKFL